MHNIKEQMDSLYLAKDATDSTKYFMLFPLKWSGLLYEAKNIFHGTLQSPHNSVILSIYTCKHDAYFVA